MFHRMSHPDAWSSVHGGTAAALSTNKRSAARSPTRIFSVVSDLHSAAAVAGRVCGTTWRTAVARASRREACGWRPSTASANSAAASCFGCRPVAARSRWRKSARASGGGGSARRQWYAASVLTSA